VFGHKWEPAEGTIAEAALRDQGVLSQQDFEAQRQKILDEF
jgi:hypothetical protein